jgi:hypothetical protein
MTMEEKKEVNIKKIEISLKLVRKYMLMDIVFALLTDLKF